jgi:hypothetical protein
MPISSNLLQILHQMMTACLMRIHLESDRHHVQLSQVHLLRSHLLAVSPMLDQQRQHGHNSNKLTGFTRTLPVL